MLNQICGNKDTVFSLQNALALGKLPHAVLICAPNGCGRNLAARALAADWLFPNGGQGAKAVMALQSPELILVEGEGKSGQITVDSIRKTRGSVFLSSLSANGRVAYIKDAHNMGPPAYNALLKVLEEPPKDVLFVLTAQSAGNLPATIVSRCASYTLAPLPQTQCQAILLAKNPNANPQTAQLLATVYSGSAGLGLAALNTQARMDVLQDALELVARGINFNEYGLLCLLQKYEGKADGERERRDKLLFDAICVLSAILRGHALPNLPQIPPKTAAKFFAPINTARMGLKGNTAPKITFAALAAQLANA